MISLRGVSLVYPNGVHALDNVTLEIAKGDFVFLVGHSGTGKSSLLRLLYREARPSSGEITVDGIRVDRLKRGRIPALRRHLGVVFQDFKLLADKTVWENVAFAMQVTGAHTKDVMRQVPRVLDLVGLSRYAEADAGVLSYGQKKLVTLAAALMSQPKIVVLDEPVAGVNPARIREVEAILRRLNGAGQTFLIIEHNVEFVTNLCHRVVVLDQGRKLAEGTPAEIHRDPRVLEAYLGMTSQMAAAEAKGAA